MPFDESVRRMVTLVGALREIESASLRTVATLESLDYEMRFVRDDLAGEYDPGDLDHAYQSMMANQVSTDDFGRVGDFGDIDAQLFFFERVVVFLFPSSRYEGVFCSFDRTDPFPVQQVIDAATGATVAADDDSR
jgi:hypothetical protein